MRLALVYCWKEWRAQRAILLAYTGLIFACLCLGLSLTPRHYWFEEGFGVHALTWFVAAGVIGVVAFVTPSLVRGEYTSNDDQFVRRLPGALRPAFGGKLLFLVLATLTLPLLGLLVGEWFVQWRESNWDGLFWWDWAGDVWLRLPWVVYASGAGLLLVPWIWAIASWMPGGRMAIGGTALFVLLLVVAVYAVLRQSPGIEQGLPWQPWLWAVVPVGLLVAALSWSRGRRGGGPWRSARFGLAAAAVAFAPPTAWLGERAWDYHHPDLDQLAGFSVQGLSPDGRFALANGAEHDHFRPVPFRIDLQTGQAEQIAGPFTGMVSDVTTRTAMSYSGRQRLWRSFDPDGESLYDLVDNAWIPVVRDPDGRLPVLPTKLQSLALAESIANGGLSAPGGDVIWFEDQLLCRRQASGEVTRLAWTEDRRGFMRVAGHGFWHFRGEVRLFDWRGREMPTPGQCDAFVVGEHAVFRATNKRPAGWQQSRIGGKPAPCAALAGYKVFGLLDDDSLLCAGPRIDGARALCRYTPSTGNMAVIATHVALGALFLDVVSPLRQQGSLLARDPRGCILIECHPKNQRQWSRLDVEAGTITPLAALPITPRHGRLDLLTWGDGDRVLASNGAAVLWFDTDTGATEILFASEAPR